MARLSAAALAASGLSLAELHQRTGVSVDRLRVLQKGREGAQDRHRARQADALGARRRGREDERRGRVQELAPVVLADAEHVESDAVGLLDLRDQSCTRSDGSTAWLVSSSAAAKLSKPISGSRWPPISSH